ncbi:MAG TPA: hypothetical protein VF771_10000 [Longimicrobiaceae bacterium]
MKKLKLNVDALRVDAFATSEEAGERGTVQAHMTNGGNTCYCTGDCTSVNIGCFCTEWVSCWDCT